MTRSIRIFDTSGRDGEQAANKMTPQTKIEWARRAAAAGVSIIEAGFPISSPAEAATVSAIAQLIQGTTICALARCVPEDIATAARSLEKASDPRIHVFLATSPIHMEKKLRMTPDEVLESVGRHVALARNYVGNVQFSPEDATRSDRDFLVRVLRVAIENGATTLNIPDTVGYALPHEYGELFSYLKRTVPVPDGIVLSAHCHNDLGLSVSNSLAAIMNGADQVEGCWNGIGERAGNTALEEVLAALFIRHEHECFSDILVQFDTTAVGPLCRFIAESIGCPIPKHKAVVGVNASAHSSGIHYNGVRKDRTTYEILAPEQWGCERGEAQLVSHLGRTGVADFLVKLGYTNPALVEPAYAKFVELAGVKPRLTQEDLHMIAQELLIKQVADAEQLLDLVDGSVDYHPGFGAATLRRNGSTERREGSGDGPVMAVLNAIRDAASVIGDPRFADVHLKDYSVVKGAGGFEANAWVVVTLELGDEIAFGRSGNPDTVVASAKAFVYALNHLTHHPVHM